jgi:starch synthase
MSKEINILFVVSEAVPFAKTGGLADVGGALPQVIRELGHEIRIMMPKYGNFSERKFRVHDVIRLKDININIGEKDTSASVKSAFITNSKIKVQVYFLANEQYFCRDGLYINPHTKKDYPDNDERFIFFCKGTLETLKKLGWKPDIIHCNDWPSALIPAYLKTVYKDDPFFANTKTLFTVHNLAYQGLFPKESFLKTGLPMELFGPNGVEFYNQFSFMKAGLVYADIISTVSEKYALEIRTEEDMGCGLKKLLEKRKKDIYGILNGMDYSVWDPEIDELIPHNYSNKNLKNKVENKKVLLQKFNLKYNDNIPVIGIISRLADQKGFDLIGETMKSLMNLDIQMVILGTGEKKYHELFEKIHKKYPEKFGVHLGFNENLAHLIEAGSDMFLMPSKYEPCGLNQMYSLKYGTVPIVRATGGLDDTIEQINEKTGSGTGFKFKKYSGPEMLNTVKKAVKLYSDKKIWNKVVKNGMVKDFSWSISAKKYISLYKKLLKDKDL